MRVPALLRVADRALVLTLVNFCGVLCLPVTDTACMAMLTKCTLCVALTVSAGPEMEMEANPATGQITQRRNDQRAGGG